VCLKIIKIVVNNNLDNFGKLFSEEVRQYLIRRNAIFFRNWNSLFPQGWNVDLMSKIQASLNVSKLPRIAF
jgi:hypothetical protein